MNNKVCLIILDGYGINEKYDSDEALEFDAVEKCTDKDFIKLLEKAPFTLLTASGEDVGLPKGQMGNSEVGHLNIGGGRSLKQLLEVIDDDIKSGEFYKNTYFNEAIDRANASGGHVHLLGLCSTGKVHSSLNHLIALMELCKQKNHLPVIQIITDGRDTDTKSGIGFAKTIEDKCFELFGENRIATISGRYYGMDREKNFDRVQVCLDALLKGEGETAFDNVSDALNDSYSKDITDEFVKPYIITKDLLLKDGDEVIFYNFRADRARQITGRFHEIFGDNVRITTMSDYDESFDFALVAYKAQNLTNTLSEVVSKAGLTQLKVAESTKYAHVTYFINGGNEIPFEKEDRILVPMAECTTFDEKPKMSARGVCEKAIEGADKGYDLIVVNYANCDMVGHTGVFEAACEAVSEATKCAYDLAKHCYDLGYTVVITADHGNADIMMKDGKPVTAHTTNRVPFYLLSNKEYALTTEGGSLYNIAPTILEVMGIDKPEDMNKDSLIKK